MCLKLFKRKQKQISLVLAGPELELFTRALKSEIDRMNGKPNHSKIESFSYTVATRYYSMSRFEGINHVLTLPFTKADSTDMLTLIVILMVEADKTEDPTDKLTIKLIAQRIQEIHKVLGV